MKAAILTYHSLDESGSVLSVSPAMFAKQMHVLAQSGVRVVMLDRLVEALRAHCGEPTVAITFDDGFRNVYEHGFPVLSHYRFPATVFLVTDYCGKANNWPTQPTDIAEQPLLDWSQVREMADAGMSFGAHTATHPDLSRLPEQAVEEELLRSKRTIEDALGRSVKTFAYPYGTFNRTVQRLAQRHFKLACSARLGFARAGSDPFALERLDLFYSRHPQLFTRLFSRATGAYIPLRHAGRELRGWRCRKQAVGNGSSEMSRRSV